MRAGARSGRRPGVDLGGAPTSSRPRRRSRPTSRRPSRACAPRSARWSTRRAGGDRTRPGARLRGGPVPAALPGADDRRHRHEGQDDDVVADRGDPRRRPGPPGRARRQHRDPDRRAAARADARPPRRRRAVGAPAADAVARHDRGRLHERHLGPPRPARDARGLPAGQAPAGRAGRPRRRARPQRRRPGGRRRTPTPRRPGRSAIAADAPPPGGLGVVDGWIVADGVVPLALATDGGHAPRPSPARSCRSPSWPSRAPTTSRTRWPRSPSRSLFGIEPEAIRAAAARVHAASSTASSRSASIDGVRFVNDSQGTQPDAVIAALRAFEPPIVLIAGGRDKGIDLVGPGPGRRRASRRGGPHRRERPDARGLVPGGRPGPHGTRHRPRRGGPPRRRASPATSLAARPARDRRPCCSARPPPASTCSRTTPRAAARSRRRSPPWPRAARRGASDEPRPADPAPRAAAPGAGPEERPRRRPIGRPSRAGPARSAARATAPTT